LQPLAVVDVETFRAMRHALLHWRTIAPPLRQGIERELGEILATVQAGPNPAGGWFLSIASVLLFSTLLSMVLLLLETLRVVRFP
jgi:hypothetical protein